MRIEVIPQDFVINATAKCMWTRQSDFVVKAIKIKNDAPNPIVIKEISFEVIAQGQKIKEISYSGQALEHYISSFPDKAKRVRGWGGQVMIGREGFWECDMLSSSPTLLSNQETGIINEFFIVVCNSCVSELIFSVCYLDGKSLKSEKQRIPVIEYKTKNNYIFPLKGSWQINGNYDCIGAHRTQYSMEFAMDFGQLNENAMVVYKQDMADEDYQAFGKEILAIADGEVIDCFNDTKLKIGFPNDRVANEEEQSEKEATIKQFGYMPVQCGNYIVIKHDNNEYSFYGHMIYHSQTVKKGDFVRQGQIIGKIGNTGKSGSPHLHFHLMNGPDYSSARGLPCHFTNIVNAMNEPLDLIREEYTIVRAE